MLHGHTAIPDCACRLSQLVLGDDINDIPNANLAGLNQLLPSLRQLSFHHSNFVCVSLRSSAHCNNLFCLLTLFLPAHLHLLLLRNKGHASQVLLNTRNPTIHMSLEQGSGCICPPTCLQAVTFAYKLSLLLVASWHRKE